MPPTETLRRQQAARALATSQGFDGLLVTEKLNYWYLTDHRSLEFDKKARPNVLLIPASGPSHLIVSTNAQAAAAAACPQAQIHTYVDVQFTPALLVDVLSSAGCACGRIGLEFGRHDRLGICIEHIDKVRRALPGLEMVSAGSLFEEVRSIKSSAEIARIRRACEISMLAWQRGLRGIKVGMRDEDIARILGSALCLEGQDINVPGHLTVGDGTRRSGPYRPGDILWCDFGATYGGYHADFSRRAVFGTARAEQLKAHADMSHVLDAMIAAMRPGVRACEIAAVGERELVKLGYAPLQGRRIGHGLGLASAERPSLAIWDETELRTGMVLTPEPNVTLPSGEHLHIEETVVITPTGSEKLSRGAEILHVIAE
jgi:Xaa-Pro aminopeptidase